MYFSPRINLLLPLVAGLLLLHGCSTTPKGKPEPQTQVPVVGEKTPVQSEYTVKELKTMVRQAIKAQDYAQLTIWSQQLWQNTHDADEKAAIQYQLWQIFKTLNRDQLTELQSQASETDNAILLQWVDLAKAWQNNQGLNRLSAVENEIALAENPDFFQPVLMQVKQEATQPPAIQKLAVFLPLSGKYKQISLQIRNGLIKNVLLKHPNITLTFYDTEENNNLVTLYQQAMDDGNDWVIGPLKKQNIQQLNTLNAENITALNQLDQTFTFIQFSLRTPSEPTQIEDKLCQANYRHLGILSSQSTGDLNLGQTLTYLWRQMPLHHAAFNSYPTRHPNLRKALGDLINETESQNRKANLRWLLQEKLTFFPRTRKDLQAIILIGNRERVAVFKPQFKFFDLKLPIYGTSKLTPKNLQHANPTKDLSKVIFPTLPAALNTTPANTVLEAFGWDSVELTLNHTLLAPNLCLNTGLTGALQVDEDKKVDRRLSWATYNHQGKIRLLER